MTRSHQRAVAAWRRQGHDDNWIQKRLAGMQVRHKFTDALQEHGVHDAGYAACTNAIYKSLLGGTCKEVLLNRDLPAKSNLRDHLVGVELISVGLTEALAEERIDAHDASGNTECERVCDFAGEARALADADRPSPKPRK